MFITTANENRFPVQVTILGESPAHFASDVLSVEDRQMCISAFHPIPLGAPLKLVFEECLWMGEVVICQPEGKQWRVCLQLEHALRDLPELLRLAERFVGKRHKEPVL